MFSWFERRLNPFPAEEPTQAPTGFFAFCWHYTKGATPFLAVTALLMAAIAVAEVWLFGFLGQIVDWLAAQDKETLLSDQFWPLLGMSALVLLGLPLLVWFHSLLTHQTLLGNFPAPVHHDLY